MSNYLVRRFAKEEVEPLVREMDENESMDPKVIKGLFEQGVSAYPKFMIFVLLSRNHCLPVLTFSPIS
jgi:hypothetical protein